MQPHRSFLSCRDATALVLASALLACTAHPAPDVALDMQHEVMPGPNESAVPSSPPARDAHVYLSPLLAAPADLSSSQPGSGVSPVTVLGERNLGGVWKFYMPQRLDVSLPGGFAYGRVATHLCRVVQHGEAISGNCLLDSVSPLSGGVLGSHLRLHLAGLTFSGRAVGWNRLQGAFALRVMGLGVTPPLPAAADRRVGAAGVPPAAGTEAAVRAALDDVRAAHLLPSRYSAGGLRQVGDILPVLRPALDALGPLQALSYADAQELIGPKGEHLGTMAVFAADFAQGTRLCGVALAPDGRTDRFMCG